MKKSLMTLCLLVLPALSFATAPVSISLTYDMGKGNLHVEAVHPSFNLEKSYVRLMNVYVNGAQVNTLAYSRQGAPDKFTDDVPLTAQVGDVIKVDLFCSLGGELAQELKVTGTGVSKTPADQGADNGTSDNATDDSQAN